MCLYTYVYAHIGYGMSLKYLILGLLNREPKSGYDLSHDFQHTVGHFWTTDRSQIYRTLHKLSDSGLLTVEVVPQVDVPDKKVYHLTEEGRQELLKWMSSPPITQPIRQAWLGLFYFHEVLEKGTILEVIDADIQTSEELYSELVALKHSIEIRVGGSENIPADWIIRQLTLDYGIERTKFELEWMQRTREKIENLKSDDS